MASHITTRQDWEHSLPKSFTPITYSRAMRKLVDLNTWGWMDPSRGYAGKQHLWSTDAINAALRGTRVVINRITGKSRVISERSRIESKQWHQVAHIEHPDTMLFYVSSPFSNVCMAGLDIDATDSSTPSDMIKAGDFLKEFLPCYVEPSTNRVGRHGYCLIDFTPYVQAHGRYEFACYANSFLVHDPCSLAHLLRLYMDSKFNIKFDNIKGYYSQYKWQKFGGRNYLQRTNAATLIKQPKPQNEAQFFALLGLPILSIQELQDKMTWLLHEVKGEVPNIEQTQLGTYFGGTSDLPPLQSANTDGSPLGLEKPSVSSSSFADVYIPGHFENVCDIRAELNANLRSRRYLYYCFMQYVLQQGREPTVEEYCSDYRRDVGTGTEDARDRGRLESIYYKYVLKMRTYRFGSVAQQIERMEGKLGLSQEDINERNTYKRSIHKREVAITALWMSLCLTNSEYIERKEWWSVHKPQHFDRELTVPMGSLKNFMKCLKSKGLTQNGCDNAKAKVLRKLLEGLGWIQCVDDSVVIASPHGGKNGRARRYILMPAHPDYCKFEKLVGADRIQYWQKFRQDQLWRRSKRGGVSMAG
jgi:hypothetical protein